MVTMDSTSGILTFEINVERKIAHAFKNAQLNIEQNVSSVTGTTCPTIKHDQNGKKKKKKRENRYYTAKKQ